ncbi:MAG: type II secretion system protein [Acidobacteriota bacterium]
MNERMKDEVEGKMTGRATTVAASRFLSPVPASTATMRRSRKSQRGFTLIELLVVVAIIGILAGMAVTNVKYAQQKAREAALRDDLFEMRKAIDNFYADKQRYPSDLKELVPHYLRKVPTDPMTKAADWEEVPVDTSDPQMQADAATSMSADGQLGGTPGIQDVKTRAQGKTIDGVSYGDL